MGPKSFLCLRIDCTAYSRHLDTLTQGCTCNYRIAFLQTASLSQVPHACMCPGQVALLLAVWLSGSAFHGDSLLLCRCTFRAGERHIEENSVTKPRAPAVYASQNSRGSHTLSGRLVDQRICSSLLHLHKAIWPLRQYLLLTASEWLRRGTGSRHNVNNPLARGSTGCSAAVKPKSIFVCRDNRALCFCVLRRPVDTQLILYITRCGFPPSLGFPLAGF